MLLKGVYWEVEIGVGVGLVVQGEMPPFVARAPESVAEHCLTEHHAVLVLFRGDVFLVVGVGDAAEEVEGAAHIDFFLGVHVEEGEIDGGASAVAAFPGEVFLREDLAFVEVGIEVAFHQRVVEVVGPSHEVIHGLLGPVGVEDLQPVAFGFQLVAHGFEGGGGFLGEEGGGLQVTVDAGADEVKGAEIPDFEDGVRDDVGDVDEAGGVGKLLDDGVLGPLHLSAKRSPGEEESY